jgi:hypothetical protein
LKRIPGTVGRYKRIGDVLFIWCSGTDTVKGWVDNFTPFVEVVGDVTVCTTDIREAEKIHTDIVCNISLDDISEICILYRISTRHCNTGGNGVYLYVFHTLSFEARDNLHPRLSFIWATTPP